MATRMDAEVFAAPAHLYRETLRGIYSGLQAQWNDPRLSDIILVRPDGRSIHAHQVILAAYSRKFAAVLGNGDATGKELPIQGVDSTALESVIAFFYRGECLLTPGTVVPIYDVCVKLEVPGLSAGCEQYIQQNLTPHTCPVFLEAAVQVLLEQVIKLCLEYAQSRFNDVVATSAFQSLGSEATRLLLVYCRTSAGEMGLARALARWAVRRPEHLPDCEAMFKELNINPTVLLQLLQSPDFVAGLQAAPPQPAAAEREARRSTGDGSVAAGAAAAGDSVGAAAAPAAGGGATTIPARPAVSVGAAGMAGGPGAAVVGLGRPDVLVQQPPQPPSRLGAGEGPSHLLVALGQPQPGASGRQLQQLLLPAALGSGAGPGPSVAAGQRSPSSSSAGGSRRNDGQGGAGLATGADRDRDSTGARPRLTSSLARGERRTGFGEAAAAGDRLAVEGGAHVGPGSVSRAAQQQQQKQQQEQQKQQQQPSLGRFSDKRTFTGEGSGTTAGVNLDVEGAYAPSTLREGARAMVGLAGSDPRDDADTPSARRQDAAAAVAAAIVAAAAAAPRSSPRSGADPDGADVEPSRPRRSSKLGPGLELAAAGPVSGHMEAAAEDIDALTSPSSGDGGGEALFAVPLSALEQAGLTLLLLRSGALAVRGGALGATALPLQVVPAGGDTNAPLLALLPGSVVQQLQQGGGSRAARAFQQLDPPPQQPSQGRQQQQQQRGSHPYSDRDLSYLAAPPPLPQQQQQLLQRPSGGRAVVGGVGGGGEVGALGGSAAGGGGGSAASRLPLLLETGAEDSSVSVGGGPGFLRESKGEILDLRQMGYAGVAPGPEPRAAGPALLPNRFGSTGWSGLPLLGLATAGGAAEAGGSGNSAPFLATTSATTAAALAAIGPQPGGGAAAAAAAAAAARGLGHPGAAAAAGAGAPSGALSRGPSRGLTATGAGGGAALQGAGDSGPKGLALLPPQYGGGELGTLPPSRWPSPAAAGSSNAAVVALAAAAAAQLAAARPTGRPPGRQQMPAEDDLPSVAAAGGSGGGKRRRPLSEEDDPDHAEESGGGGGGGRGAGGGSGGAARGGRNPVGGREGSLVSMPGSKPAQMCHVDDCHVDLSNLKEYHQRFRICDFHLKAETVMRDGIPQRFCQQCGRFHLLSEFDGTKRSCRARLQRHNARRRKRPEQRGSGGDGGSDEQRKPGRSPSYAPSGQRREGAAAPPPLQQPLAALRDAAVAAGLRPAARSAAAPGALELALPEQHPSVTRSASAQEGLQEGGDAGAASQGQPFSERSSQGAQRSEAHERGPAAATAPTAAEVAAAVLGFVQVLQQPGGPAGDVRPMAPPPPPLPPQQQLLLQAPLGAVAAVRVKEEAEMQRLAVAHGPVAGSVVAEVPPSAERVQYGGTAAAAAGSIEGGRGAGGGEPGPAPPPGGAAMHAASGSHGSFDSDLDNDTAQFQSRTISEGEQHSNRQGAP